MPRLEICRLRASVGVIFPGGSGGFKGCLAFGVQGDTSDQSEVRLSKEEAQASGIGEGRGCAANEDGSTEGCGCGFDE